MALSIGKRVSFILSIGLASILVVILVVEGVARLASEKKHVAPRNIGQFDKKLGWSLKPSSHGVGWIGESKIHYRINSKGIRDDEKNYKKPDDIFRIVMIGDSNTFGYGVPIEKHFTSLIEGYFKDVETINMGVSAYGVDQELLALQLEGFRYEPDLVLAYVPHFVGHRHMHARRYFKSKPRFELIDGKLVLTKFPVKKPSVHKSTLQKIQWWFFRHSRAYKIVSDRLRYFKYHEKSEQITQKRIQQDKKDSKDETFRTKLFSLGGALIHAMHVDSTKRGATFILVTRMPELHEAALKKQLFSLDVAKPLRNSRFALNEPSGHMNESGNGVLAYEIARFLLKNSLIPQKHILSQF